MGRACCRQSLWRWNYFFPCGRNYRWALTCPGNQTTSIYQMYLTRDLWGLIQVSTFKSTWLHISIWAIATPKGLSADQPPLLPSAVLTGESALPQTVYGTGEGNQLVFLAWDCGPRPNRRAWQLKQDFIKNKCHANKLNQGTLFHCTSAHSLSAQIHARFSSCDERNWIQCSWHGRSISLEAAVEKSVSFLSASS